MARNTGVDVVDFNFVGDRSKRFINCGTSRMENL